MTTQERAAELVLEAAVYARHRQRNLCRPSVILEADLEGALNPAGELVYVASYGSLFVVGDTPELAFENFDRVWVEGL